jgi:hypothetical protein
MTPHKPMLIAFRVFIGRADPLATSDSSGIESAGLGILTNLVTQRKAEPRLVVVAVRLKWSTLVFEARTSGDYRATFKVRRAQERSERVVKSMKVTLYVPLLCTSTTLQPVPIHRSDIVNFEHSFAVTAGDV